jgi:hypothetical protein
MFGCLVREEATVDDEFGAGDEGGVGSRQERDCTGGLADAGGTGSGSSALIVLQPATYVRLITATVSIDGSEPALVGGTGLPTESDVRA